MSKNHSLLIKSALLSVLLITGALTSHVLADRVVYSYDAAGNRISAHRQILYSPQRSTGVDEIKSYNDSLSNARITIYPNPTEGDLRIDITGIDNFERSEVTIHSSNGTVLNKISPLTASNEVDMTTYEDGIYLFVIRINDETTTWKIIKK